MAVLDRAILIGTVPLRVARLSWAMTILKRRASEAFIVARHLAQRAGPVACPDSGWRVRCNGGRDAVFGGQYGDGAADLIDAGPTIGPCSRPASTVRDSA